MEHGANGRSTSSATTCESSPTRADRPRSRQHERRGAPSRAQLRTPRNQREAATTGQGSLSRLIELRSGTAFRFGPTHLDKGKSHVHWRRSDPVYRGRRGHCLVDAEKLTVSRDRKSTRLNSSHLGISYAVF